MGPDVAADTTRGPGQVRQACPVRQRWRRLWLISKRAAFVTSARYRQGVSVRIDAEERRVRLAERHLLLSSTRTDSLPQIADDLVALHSSDPVSVFLSAMARMIHPSIEAVEKALYTDRSLIRHHAMRRTLWVATPPMVRLMHAAATRDLLHPARPRP